MQLKEWSHGYEDQITDESDRSDLEPVIIVILS